LVKIKTVKIYSVILLALFSTNIFSFSLNYCFSGETKSCCCKTQNSDSKSNIEFEKFKKNCSKRVKGCGDFSIEAKVESFILPEKQNFSILISDVTIISEENFSKIVLSPDFLKQKFSPDKYIENCNFRI
jgi:hypothetical protein